LKLYQLIGRIVVVVLFDERLNEERIETLANSIAKISNFLLDEWT